MLILKRSIVSALILSAVMPFFAMADKDSRGTIIGGLIGGLIGNKTSDREHRDSATAIGVVIGAVAGNSIGKDLDEADRQSARYAYNDALNGNDMDRSHRWDGRGRGSRTGVRGYYRNTRYGYHFRYGTYCREFESVVIYSRRHQTRTYSYVCQARDGRWIEVNRYDVDFNTGYYESDRNDNGRGDGHGRRRHGRR